MCGPWPECDVGFWRERRGAAGEVKGLTERGSPLVPLLSFKSSDVRVLTYGIVIFHVILLDSGVRILFLQTYSLAMKGLGTVHTQEKGVITDHIIKLNRVCQQWSGHKHTQQQQQ